MPAIVGRGRHARERMGRLARARARLRRAFAAGGCIRTRRGIYTAGMTEILATRAVFGTAQIRQLERHAVEVLQLPPMELMRRAAEAAWQRVRSEWPLARSLLVACGPGNNGGDGCLLAALAKAADWQVDVIALAPLTASHPGFEALQHAGVQVQIHVPGQPLPQADLQVDAIFGIGLNRAPEGLAADLIQALNAGAAPRLALDCPSGLNADTGSAPGAVVRADATITFLAGKSGLVTGQARNWVGRLLIETLGLDEVVAALSPVATALPWPQLPSRPRAAHKGSNGHLLVVGGEHGTGGAVHLAAMAALRSGAGLVSVATRSEQVLVVFFVKRNEKPEITLHYLFYWVSSIIFLENSTCPTQEVVTQNSNKVSIWLDKTE